VNNNPSYCQSCVWANHAKPNLPQYEMLSTFCIEAHCDGCGRYSLLAMGKLQTVTLEKECNHDC
jgi:hypothetical protein